MKARLSLWTRRNSLHLKRIQNSQCCEHKSTHPSVQRCCHVLQLKMGKHAELQQKTSRSAHNMLTCRSADPTSVGEKKSCRLEPGTQIKASDQPLQLYYAPHRPSRQSPGPIQWQDSTLRSEKKTMHPARIGVLNMSFRIKRSALRPQARKNVLTKHAHGISEQADPPLKHFSRSF